MDKKERLVKDPFSMRFEDFGELWNSMTTVKKMVSFIFFFSWISIFFYMLLCEIEYSFKS